MIYTISTYEDGTKQVRYRVRNAYTAFTKRKKLRDNGYPNAQIDNAPVATVRTAVNTMKYTDSRYEAAVVGITEGGQLVLCNINDYDGAGTIYGDYRQLSLDEDLFDLCFRSYPEDIFNKLRFTNEDRQRVRDEIVAAADDLCKRNTWN